MTITETALTETVLTEVQAAAAWKLGRAYGHLWAELLTAEEAAGKTSEQIALLARERDESVIGGIYAPQTDKFGEVVHTTGSGRLSWEISPEGQTMFKVSRPAHDAPMGGYAYGRDDTPPVPVLFGQVLTEDLADGGEKANVYRMSPRHASVCDDPCPRPALQRHYEAMARAMAAILPEWASVPCYEDGDLVGSLEEQAGRLDPLHELIGEAAKWAAAGSVPAQDDQNAAENAAIAAQYDALKREEPAPGGGTQLVLSDEDKLRRAAEMAVANFASALRWLTRVNDTRSGGKIGTRTTLPG